MFLPVSSPRVVPTPFLTQLLFLLLFFPFPNSLSLFWVAVNSTDRGLSALGSAYQEPYLQRKTNLLEKPWATYDGFSARGVVCECHSPVWPEDVWLQPFQRPAFCDSAILSSGMVAEPGRKCDKKAVPSVAVNHLEICSLCTHELLH